MDQLRRRVEPGSGLASTTLDDAVARLARAIDVHFDDHDISGAAADRLMKALDVVPQGIVLAEADGVVVFHNRAAAEFLTARHGDALVGEAITELIATSLAGTGQTRTLDLFGPPRRAIQVRAVPLRAVQPDSSVSSPSVGSSDRPIDGAFLVVEDVSERQRLDTVRRDFVANISHELKTPVGALGVLAETLAGETDPVVVERLATRLQDEAFRVAHTIDDLLQLSQIEVSGVLEPEEVLVSTVVGDAVDRIRPAADERRVQIRTEFGDRDLKVVGDRRQLVSAVANLCDNAVKYSEVGGDVVVSVATDSEWVDIAVADNGIGIPARDVERIFERFYRVDRARSRHTGGTGLGLAIVRHVVNNHEGKIEVVSWEGEGSTFTLRLPAPAPIATSSPVDTETTGPPPVGDPAEEHE
ncbi:MAG: ATP-binding protein [Aquihabitans sp.]